MTRDEGTPFAVERGVIAFHLRALRSRIRVLLVITAAALALGIAWVAQRTPVYAASAQVLVAPLAQTDQTFFGVSLLRDSGDSARTLDTTVPLLDSPAAAAGAARTMGKGWDRPRVARAVTVAPRHGTNIIEIKGRGDSPREAARLANGFASASLAQRSKLLSHQASIALKRAQTQLGSLGRLRPDDAADLLNRVNKLAEVANGTDPTLSLVRPAIAPLSPSGAADWVLVMLTGIGGLALGAGTILLLEVLDRRIRDEEDILESYPLPVLTRLPQIPRQQRQALAGRDPALSPLLRERFRMIGPQLGAGVERGRKILITSPSPGDGKTTAAIGLALSLLGVDRSVLLADLDVRAASLSERLDKTPGEGVERLLHPDSTLRELVSDVPMALGLSVLPAVRTHDLVLIDAIMRRLPQLLAEADELVDFVVIDAPALGEVGDALWLADEVDDVVLVARPGNTLRAHLEITRDMLERAGHTPDGLIIVGGPDARVGQYGSGHYGYGASGGQRGALPAGAARAIRGLRSGR